MKSLLILPLTRDINERIHVPFFIDTQRCVDMLTKSILFAASRRCNTCVLSYRSIWPRVRLNGDGAIVTLDSDTPSVAGVPDGSGSRAISSTW